MLKVTIIIRGLQILVLGLHLQFLLASCNSLAYQDIISGVLRITSRSLNQTDPEPGQSLKSPCTLPIWVKAEEKNQGINVG